MQQELYSSRDEIRNFPTFGGQYTLMRIERGLDSQNCQQAIHHQHFQYAVPVSCMTLPGDITLYKQLQVLH